MQAPVTRLLSLTATTIFIYLIKKTLILVPNWDWLMNYWGSFKNLCRFAIRISIISKSLKSKPIIKAKSLEAIFLIIRFSWIANISKLNKIKSWKPNFLVFFKFCIQLANKPTNLNFQRNRKSMTFFIYPYWSKTVPRRSK